MPRLKDVLACLLPFFLFSPPSLEAQVCEATINGCTYSQENFMGKAYAETSACSGFVPALCDIVEHVASAWVGSSGTSLELGLGTRSLTVVGNGFAAYQPVRLAVDEARWMDGTITAYDATTGAMTVEVEAFSGTGTFTSWSVFVLRSEVVAASSPVAIAEGGTGATSAAGARQALGVGRSWIVEHAATAPRGDETAGDRVRVVGAGAPNPLNPFFGHESEIAEYDGADWTFATPEEGALVYDREAETIHRSNGIGWERLATENDFPRQMEATTSNLFVTADDRHVLVDASAGPVTITLPDVTPDGSTVTVSKVDASANVVTVNVSSAGTIDGATTAVLATQYDSLTADYWSNVGATGPAAGWFSR